MEDFPKMILRNVLQRIYQEKDRILELCVFVMAVFHLRQAYHVEIPNKSWKFDE